MTKFIVKSQAEYDSALKKESISHIVVDAPPGEGFEIFETGGKRVDIVGATKVYLLGGSASITYVGDSASITDVGGSASITDVGDSASITYVRDSASITDVGGSASITYVRGSASITYVGDSASITDVRGSASIHIYGGTVGEIGQFVAVFLHTKTVKPSGGRIIDLTELDMTDPAAWCEFHGVKVAGGVATLYKAVDADLRSGTAAPRASENFQYPLETEVVAPDWMDDNRCGGGLHMCATPGQARDYASGYAKRYLAVEVRLEDLRPINDLGTPKAKVRAGFVAYEVGLNREKLAD